MRALALVLLTLCLGRATFAQETAGQSPPTPPPPSAPSSPQDPPAQPPPPEKCAHWSLEGKVGWSGDAHAYALEGGYRLTKHAWVTVGVVRITGHEVDNKTVGAVGVRYEW